MAWTANTTTGGTNYSISYAPVNVDLPMLFGSGPVEASTCTELSVLPVWIFDVNGYYRELGVRPQATRRELREAYQAKDGQSDARLTYILSQLLNPEVRAVYDRLPLGDLLVDDYVRDFLNKKAQTEARRRMADRVRMGFANTEAAQESVLRDVFGQMGLPYDPPPTPEEVSDDTQDSGPEILDPEPVMDKHVSSPAKQFLYSYYLWRAPQPDQDLLARLVEWQSHIIGVLARKGVRTGIAVGLMGHLPHGAVSGRIGYRTVFFLNIEVSPTRELAEQIIVQSGLAS